jgi:predicted DNA-binding transcriptional regulator AlpA
LKAAIDGESMQQTQPIEYLTVSQKAAAKLLSVSRVTIWRMTRDNLLHPVEIFPGTWRYPFEELAILIRQGWPRRAEIQRKPRALSA